MTYFGFLLRFVFLPILLLSAITCWDERRSKALPGFQKGQVWRSVLVHVILAVLYTTPWDNYLVATGVWSYNPRLVTGLVFGWVPIEEYTFFVVETVLCSLCWLMVARRTPLLDGFKPNKKLVMIAAAMLAALWVFFAFLFFAGPQSANYLSITMFWALPAIFPQILFGADILWHFRNLLFWAIVPTSLYLSLTDIVALKATTWAISPTHTTGVLFLGILPVEEVLFFFVTSSLIAFGLTLMLSNISHNRFSIWRSTGFKGLP